MDEVIVAEDVRKRYNGFEALRGVSLRVRRGEVYGLLGPNGAGKTTLMGILVTLIRPTSGRALVAGYDVVREPGEVRKRIGVVFQEPTVDRDLTAWQNLYIHGLIYGLSRGEIERRARELMELVGLSHAMHRSLRSYSGGMLRRFEIARALLAEPEVLFMDEPTVGLDPQARARVWEVIESLRDRGVTVFLTTHYMEEAERLCDRIAIIDHGKIIAEGSPEELKARIGGDTLYLKAASRQEAERLLGIASRYGEARLAGDGLTVVLAAGNATRLLPRLLEEASAAGVRVEEARYVRPTLNDVFLMLTGRSLRDEEGGWRDWMMLHMRAGRGMR